MDRKEELLSEITARLQAARKAPPALPEKPAMPIRAVILGVVLGATVTAASATIVVSRILAKPDPAQMANRESPREFAGFDLYQPVRDLCEPSRDLLDLPPTFRDYSGI